MNDTLLNAMLRAFGNYNVEDLSEKVVYQLILFTLIIITVSFMFYKFLECFFCDKHEDFESYNQRRLITNQDLDWDLLANIVAPEDQHFY